MTKSLNRIRRLERQREASKPARPWLVVLETEDEAAKLAEFRTVRGCEPERIIRIRVRRAGTEANHEQK